MGNFEIGSGPGANDTPCVIIRHVLGGMLRILVIGLLVLVAIFFALPRPSVAPPANATELPEARRLPDVLLLDQYGERFVTSELEGGYTLLFFGFTNCPDVCPLTMQVLAFATDRMREAGATPPKVVLASVDPARDSPERLREYLENFDAEFIGVVGQDDALDPWLSGLGITVMRQELDGGSYNMVHNPQVFVLNSNAELIAIMSSADDPAVVVVDFERIRTRHANGVDVSPRR